MRTARSPKKGGPPATPHCAARVLVAAQAHLTSRTFRVLGNDVDSATPSSCIRDPLVTEKFATVPAWTATPLVTTRIQSPLARGFPVVVDGEETLAVLRRGDRSIRSANRHLERLCGAGSKYPGRVFRRRYRRVPVRRRRLSNHDAVDCSRWRILVSTECTGSLGNPHAAVHECARKAGCQLGTWRRLPPRLRAVFAAISIADSGARDATSLTVHGGVNMTWLCARTSLRMSFGSSTTPFRLRSRATPWLFLVLGARSNVPSFRRCSSSMN